MKKIPYETIIDIQKKVNIVDIISDYLPLSQKGKNYFAICPFHDDHNPSMSISEEKQIYKCFVCGASGNVYHFIMNYEKINFVNAVDTVAKKLNIDLNIKSSNKSIESQKYKEDYELYDVANKFYQNNINSEYGEAAKKYLEKRDINSDIIKEFQIGVAFSDNMLSKLLLSKKYSEDKITSAGLAGKTNNFVFDIFRNRIMFPLWDLNGKPVGFSGRIYDDSDENKYVNSRESDIFKKGEILYNYHRALGETKTTKSIIVVEGFLDVIRLYINGIKNVVAIMGTALTKHQALSIKRLSINVVLCFDGDTAGQKATISAVKELESIGISPKIIKLEDNLDPDDYIMENGVKAFKYYIDNPMTLLDYKLFITKQKVKLDNFDDVSKYLKFAISELSKTNDPIIRELTIKKLEKETSVDIATINKMLYENKDIVKSEVIPPRRVINKKKDVVQNAEEALIYYMLNYEGVIDIYDKKISYLNDDKLMQLANSILLFYDKFKYFNTKEFLTYLEDKEDLIRLIIEIDEMTFPNGYTNEQIDDYINVIDKGVIRRKTNKIRNLLQEETNEVKKRELLEKLADIKKKELY